MEKWRDMERKRRVNWKEGSPTVRLQSTQEERNNNNNKLYLIIEEN